MPLVELTQLVQAGGGKVLGREPRDPRPVLPYHSVEGHYKSTSFIVQVPATAPPPAPLCVAGKMWRWFVFKENVQPGPDTVEGPTRT